MSGLILSLKSQDAMHSCCVVILSTGDPRELRKTVGFEPVTEYEHLKGALYRKVIAEDDFIGSVAVYLVVLNELPVYALNAPLLVLSTKKKKIEFCKWLTGDIPGITLEEKREYLIYLLEHHLIDNKEVEIEIMHEMFGKPNRSWIFNYLDQRPEEEKEQFRQLFYEKMLDAQNRVEAALKVVQTEEERRDLMARLQQMGI